MQERQSTVTVLVLNAATLGRGDDDLGAKLMPNFLRKIAFRDRVPETVVCYNTGVRLAEQGGPCLPMMEALAQKGADIILCGTCVDSFQIADRLAVGRVGDMEGIVDAISRADKVMYV